MMKFLKKAWQITLLVFFSVALIVWIKDYNKKFKPDFLSKEEIEQTLELKESCITDTVIQQLPISIWNKYGVDSIWNKYGKGKGVNVAILEFNYDLDSGIPYTEAVDFYCIGKDFCEEFDLVGRHVEHGTSMWYILSQVAPEANIHLLRHYGAWDLSALESALYYIENNDIDIAVSAVLFATTSKVTDNWIKNTKLKEFILASPPSHQDLYSTFYTEDITTVVGIKGLDGKITANEDPTVGYWTTSNPSLVDVWLPEYYVLTKTVGGKEKQVFGTSPASFVYAGMQACKLTKK